MDGAQASGHVDSMGRHLVFDCASEELRTGQLQSCSELIQLPWQTTTGPPIRYHSLLAELGDDAMLAGGLHHLQRFREFVVFRGNLVYPEYVVAVSKRLQSLSCSTPLVRIHNVLALNLCVLQYKRVQRDTAGSTRGASGR